MDYTGPDSFSDSFRKGEMEKTVTVGYTNMTKDPWKHSYRWQDFMFQKMDEKNTIYTSFIAACAEYPEFAEVVVFIGDENLKVNGSKSRSDTSSLTTKPLLLQLIEEFPLLCKLLSQISLINFKL